MSALSPAEQPVIVGAVVTAAVGLAARYGLELDGDLVAALTTIVGAIVTLVVRQAVTPNPRVAVTTEDPAAPASGRFAPIDVTEAEADLYTADPIGMAALGLTPNRPPVVAPGPATGAPPAPAPPPMLPPLPPTQPHGEEPRAR